MGLLDLLMLILILKSVVDINVRVKSTNNLLDVLLPTSCQVPTGHSTFSSSMTTRDSTVSCRKEYITLNIINCKSSTNNKASARSHITWLAWASAVKPSKCSQVCQVTNYRSLGQKNLSNLFCMVLYNFNTKWSQVHSQVVPSHSNPFILRWLGSKQSFEKHFY